MKKGPESETAGYPDLTLKDLIDVLFEDPALPENLVEWFQHAVVSDPRNAKLVAYAEQARRDAGVEKLWEGLHHAENLEELLEAEGWEDPIDVLQPGHKDISSLGYRQLVLMAEARIARGEGSAEMQAVKERIERAERKEAKEALEKLVQEVQRLSPGSARRMVNRANEALAAAVKKAKVTRPDSSRTHPD